MQISPYAIPGVPRRNVFSPMIKRLEDEYNLPAGSIAFKSFKKGRPRQINGQDITIFRAALAKVIKRKYPELTLQDIAPIVGVKRYCGVHALLKVCASYEFTKDFNYMKILKFLENGS